MERTGLEPLSVKRLLRAKKNYPLHKYRSSRVMMMIYQTQESYRYRSFIRKENSVIYYTSTTTVIKIKSWRLKIKLEYLECRNRGKGVWLLGLRSTVVVVMSNRNRVLFVCTLSESRHYGWWCWLWYHWPLEKHYKNFKKNRNYIGWSLHITLMTQIQPTLLRKNVPIQGINTK